MSTFQKFSLWQKYMISKELTATRKLSYGRIEKLIVRQPMANRLKKMHPKQQLDYSIRTQEPLPLKYKLQEFNQSTINIPLGVKEDIPFNVERNNNLNLPVYTKYGNKHIMKKTIIRNISGNVYELKDELSKITSNSAITIKTNRLEIEGIHAEKVKLYLARLGF